MATPQGRRLEYHAPQQVSTHPSKSFCRLTAAPYPPPPFPPQVQTRQICGNVTTNELINWHRYPGWTREDGSFVNPYDRGIVHNVRQVSASTTTTRERERDSERQREKREREGWGGGRLQLPFRRTLAGPGSSNPARRHFPFYFPVKPRRLPPSPRRTFTVFRYLIPLRLRIPRGAGCIAP